MNENGRCLHASCGLVSVMFIRQPQKETERERDREREREIPDASANKPRKPHLCN